MKNFLIIILMFSQTIILGQVTLSEVIKNNSYVVGKELNGRGWTYIQKKARKANYFLIGEVHGIAQVPQITESLFKSLYRKGYKHLAIETGPVTSGIILDSLKAGVDLPEMEKEYPYSFPFYGRLEEAKLLKTVVEISDAKEPIWGLDQEFVLAPRLLFKTFRNGFEPKNLLDDELEKAKTGYQKMVETKNPQTAWMAEDKQKTYEALLKTAKTDSAKLMLKELKLSQDIYNMYYTGKGQDNNNARVAQFIKWFELFEKRNETDKIMIKMGATHIMKGESIYGVIDLGDYLANQRKEKTFHLGIFAASGFTNEHKPFGGEKSAPISHTHTKQLLSLVKDFLPENGDYLLLDMSALRSYAHLFPKDKVLHKLINGFDAILLLQNAKASTMIE